MTEDRAFEARLDEACRRLTAEADQFDAEGADPAALCIPLSSCGLFRDALPDDGGAGLIQSPERLCEALLEIGAASLSAARLYEGHVNAAQLVSRLGDADQVRAQSRAVAGGAVLGVWNAESPPGLHLAPSNEGLRLVGGKIYTSGIGVVTHPLVTARSPEGEVRLLSLGSPISADVSTWRARGMRATATGSVDYSGVLVEPSMLIGGPGAYYGSPQFKGGAWRFAAAQAGAIIRIQQLAAQALRHRGRQDDPAQKARQAELAIAAHSAQSWCREAACRERNAESDAPAFEAFVGLTRLAVEAAAMQAIALAERSVGLSAFLQPDPLDRVIRDLGTYLRQPFPDVVKDEVGGFMATCGGVPPWSVLAGACR